MFGVEGPFVAERPPWTTSNAGLDKQNNRTWKKIGGNARGLHVNLITLGIPATLAPGSCTCFAGCTWGGCTGACCACTCCTCTQKIYSQGAKVWFQRQLTWPELFAEQNAGAPAAGLEGCKVLQKSFDLKFISYSL